MSEKEKMLDNIKKIRQEIKDIFGGEQVNKQKKEVINYNLDDIDKRLNSKKKM